MTPLSRDLGHKSVWESFHATVFLGQKPNELSGWVCEVMAGKPSLHE
jgi:hypothetical protein